MLMCESPFDRSVVRLASSDGNYALAKSKRTEITEDVSRFGISLAFSFINFHLFSDTFDGVDTRVSKITRDDCSQSFRKSHFRADDRERVTG